MDKGDENKAYRRRQERRFPQHSCELAPHPDRVYPVLPPNATRWMRVRRLLQKQVVGWSASQSLRAIRPSTYLLEAEQARQTHNKHWWIVHPFSRFFAIWQLVVIASVAMTTFLIPLEYVFMDPYRFLGHLIDGTTTSVHPYMDANDPETKLYKQSLKHTNDNVTLMSQINDVIFFVHVMLMFVIGYYQSSTKEVVLAPSRIIKRYLTTWFIPDFLSCIHYTDGNRNIVTQNYMTFKDASSSEFRFLVQAWFIAYFFKSLRLHYVYIYSSTWCDMAKLRPTTRRVIQYLVVFIGYIAWSMMYCVQIPLLVRGVNILRNGSESWLMDEELGFFDVHQPHLLLRQQLISLNRVVGLMTSHIPEVSSQEPKSTTEDSVVTLIIMWSSAVFKIVLFALVLQYVDGDTSAETELEKVRGQVRSYLREEHLPVYVRDKMLLYYSHRFHNRFFKERAIVAHLPTSVRNAVRFSSCRQLVSSSTLFRGVPKSLVNSIVAALREDLFLPNDVVYSSGDPARYLYFLSEGTVGVYLSTGEEVGHLVDGASFGEMGIMLTEHRRRHMESVVALEVCEIFLLERRDFERLVRPLPRLHNRIRAAAMLRATEVAHMEWAGNDDGFGYGQERPLSPKTSATSAAQQEETPGTAA